MWNSSGPVPRGWDRSPRALGRSQKTFILQARTQRKKDNKYHCFFGCFRTFGEYHFFSSEKLNCIPFFGPGLEKKFKQISLCFWTFPAIWGIFYFCGKNNILFINWAWYFGLGTGPAEYCTYVNIYTVQLSCLSSYLLSLTESSLF